MTDHDEDSPAITEAGQVRRWATQLEREIARGSDPFARGSDLLSRSLRDAQSTYEVVRRGLDPDQPRLFRGMVSLTIRCKRRGHVLGYVYPTRFDPVFVPTVSALSGGIYREKAARANSRAFGRQTEQLNAEVLIAEGMRAGEADKAARFMNGDLRDHWIEADMRADPAPNEPLEHYSIRGLAVLSLAYLADRDDLPEGVTNDMLASPLVCRCGTRLLYTTQLREVLAAKRPTLAI
jgi:hypothetical protein